MELTDNEFQNFRQLVSSLCGLVIPDEKRYLITHRLMPIMKSSGCETWSAFYRLASSSNAYKIKDEIISAMTTNETSFFRDGHPFEVFKTQILPMLGQAVMERKARDMQRKGAKVRLWSVASSTGQEPYTLAMLIHEYAKLNEFKGISVDDFSILATDISSRALAQAMSGEYSDLEISRGLPQAYKKYFYQSGKKWLIHDHIKTMVEFKKLNLMGSLTMLGGFDFIICRNVLIYFNDATKKKILDQFHTMLSPGSYLMLGTSEGLYGLTERFVSQQTGQTILYKKD